MYIYTYIIVVAQLVVKDEIMVNKRVVMENREYRASDNRTLPKKFRAQQSTDTEKETKHKESISIN